MLGFFSGKRKKSPEQTVQALKEQFDAWKSSEGKEHDKDLVELGEKLVAVKIGIFGDPDAKTEAPEDNREQFANLMAQSSVMKDLVFALADLEFEMRKQVCLIFCHLMRKDVEEFATRYVATNITIVDELLRGYEHASVALISGSMLRECIRHEALARYVLYEGDLLDKLFCNYVHVTNFEVSSDAFETLRDLLTRHKGTVAEYLDAKFDKVFGMYNILLNSDNYVTRRLSLKLLSELLLDRENFQVMLRFISDRNNLKMIMTMLRDPRQHIQFEAFHVFKVFVANPRKPAEITTILVANKAKLIDYLTKFGADKQDDEQFMAEKKLLVNLLQGLTAPAAPAPPAAAAAPAAAVGAAAAPVPAGSAATSATSSPAAGGDASDDSRPTSSTA